MTETIYDPKEFRGLHERDGAVPSLTATSDDVLGAPKDQAKGKTNVNTLFVLVGGLLALGLLIGSVIWFVKHRADAKAAAPPVAAKKIGTVDADSDAMAKRQTELKKKDAAAAVEAATAQAETDRMKALAAQEAAAKNPNPAQNPAMAGVRQPANSANAAPLPPVVTPADRKLGGCVLIGCVDPKAKDVAVAKATATSAAPSAGTGAAAPAPAPATGFAALYEPTVLSGRLASRLSDLTYLLTKGTSIPCGLKTAIDTTLPGLVVCQTTKDVYSANGKLLLIERGSKVFGEQKAALSQGQDRVFALWTRIDTPQGVSINIDSPITDSLGRSGAEAYVDTHFWERFGAAIMLSLLDGVNFNIQSPYTIGTPIGYITPSVSNGNASNSSNSGTSSNKSIAAEVLKNSINIPPTGNINAGVIVNVMVARDVSFQGVYGLVQ